MNIPMIDIILALSNAIDLIDPDITDHHKRVGYISYRIAKEMNLPDNQIKDIVLAGLIHDCGAISASERSGLFEFEFQGSLTERFFHGYKGWYILRDTDTLKEVSEIIKFHHVFYANQAEGLLDTYEIPLGSYIIHLADRIDILINRNQEILSQRRDIVEKVNKASGTMFMPQVVEAFNTLVPKPYFWFDIVSPYLYEMTKKILSSYIVTVDSKSFIQYADIAHRMIDFRSRFTAAHSIGVAASASILAEKFSFNQEDCQLMYSAGLMHDLGKLCISEKILEKPGPLDNHEFSLMKAHTYHTYRIIDGIPGLDKVRDWAAFHHEKLDGKGYPFALKADQLDLGSRILAVSDIFTALTESRPYRKAMSTEVALDIINRSSNLDYDVKYCLRKNLDEINHIRKSAQESALNNMDQIFISGSYDLVI